MSRFANLADKTNVADRQKSRPDGNELSSNPESPTVATPRLSPPSARVGRKAIAGYFSPEMSLAMHVCARKQGLSLQDLMAEAFDDVLRKYGESPVGR